MTMDLNSLAYDIFIRKKTPNEGGLVVSLENLQVSNLTFSVVQVVSTSGSIRDVRIISNTVTSFESDTWLKIIFADCLHHA